MKVYVKPARTLIQIAKQISGNPRNYLLRVYGVNVPDIVLNHPESYSFVIEETEHGKEYSWINNTMLAHYQIML